MRRRGAPVLVLAALVAAGLVPAFGGESPGEADEAEAAKAFVRLDPPISAGIDSVVKIRGRAASFSTLRVTVNGKDQGVFRAEKNGRFERGVTLDAGKNTVTFTAIEELPQGSFGILFRMLNEEGLAFRPSGWCDFSPSDEGVRTMRSRRMNYSEADIYVSHRATDGAHILEMRIRNATPFKTWALTVHHGPPGEEMTKTGPLLVEIPPLMETFRTLRWDLAEIAGVQPGEQTFVWKLRPLVPGQDPEADTPSKIRHPLEFDFVRQYGWQDPAAAEAEPVFPSASLTLQSTATPLAEDLAAMRERFSALRTETKQPLRWGKGYGLLQRAIDAARRHDYAAADAARLKAGTVLYEMGKGE